MNNNYFRVISFDENGEEDKMYLKEKKNVNISFLNLESRSYDNVLNPVNIWLLENPCVNILMCIRTEGICRICA